MRLRKRGFEATAQVVSCCVTANVVLVSGRADVERYDVIRRDGGPFARWGPKED